MTVHGSNIELEIRRRHERSGYSETVESKDKFITCKKYDKTLVPNLLFFI